MHLDLLKSIPLELRDRLDEEYALLLRVRPADINVMWPRLWPIISFRTRDDLVIQSCKQYLSHHQCIISTLLFGLSLSPLHLNSGPVISKNCAALYLNSAIRTVEANNSELDLSWLMLRHKNLWIVICKQYLALSQSGAKFPPRLIHFAQSQTRIGEVAA